MAGYCAITDVTGIVNTSMTNDQVDILINGVSAVMKITVDTTIDTDILRLICQTWTAYQVMLKDPTSWSLAEYREDRGEQLKALWNLVLFYIQVTNGGGVNFIPASESIY